MATAAPSTDRSDRRYIAAAMEAPLLERDHEAELARRWLEDHDQTALHEIITAHVRLVVRIASRFRGYGLPVSDLIQEGNIGLLEAANRFDPERQVRFSTYATWWIMAAIQDYIVRNASIVRIGTTPAQKSLFFNLRRLRAKHGGAQGVHMTDEERRTIAQELRVPLAAVERMESHLFRPDRSLNASVGAEDTDELQDFLADERATPEETVGYDHDTQYRSRQLHAAMETLTPRERQIISRRFLGDDKTTLAEIGEDLGVTKERIRQIESKALTKLRQQLSETVASGDRLAQ